MEPIDVIRAYRPKPANLPSDSNKTIGNWAEVKYDGYRMLIERKADGKLVAISRQFHTNLIHKLEPNSELMDCLKGLPPDSMVEGEVHCYKSSSDISSVLATYSGEFEFHAFAMPRLNGRWLIKESLPLVRGTLLCYDFNIVEQLPIVPSNQEMALQAIAERDIEGLVFKLDHYTTWFKLKPKHSLDGIVVGTTPGKGKYKNQVGSLEIAVWEENPISPRLIVVANVSGMTDTQRQEITDSEMGVIGRVVEIEHDGFQVNRVRFPRFKRWREDKPTEQCTFDQCLETTILDETL